jgi:hypothetical protein
MAPPREIFSSGEMQHVTETMCMQPTDKWLLRSTLTSPFELQAVKEPQARTGTEWETRPHS